MASFEEVNGIALMDEILADNSDKNTWVFDCDGTLINSDISTFTGWAIIRHGLCNPELIPAPWLTGRKYMNMPFTEFEAMHDHVVQGRGVMGGYEWEIMLQAGLTPKMVMDIASGILDECLKDQKIRFTRHVSVLAKKIAPQAWVVSGSSHPTVSSIVKNLGIPSERVLATCLETVDGVYQNYFQEPGVVWEDKKRWVLEKSKVMEPFFVAGDTIGDWAMMQMSKKWKWCVLWDDYRHRGLEWRHFLQKNVFENTALPTQPGFYKISFQNRTWVIEIKGDFT